MSDTAEVFEAVLAVECVDCNEFTEMGKFSDEAATNLKSRAGLECDWCFSENVKVVKLTQCPEDDHHKCADESHHRGIKMHVEDI